VSHIECHDADLENVQALDGRNVLCASAIVMVTCNDLEVSESLAIAPDDQSIAVRYAHLAQYFQALGCEGWERWLRPWWNGVVTDVMPVNVHRSDFASALFQLYAQHNYDKIDVSFRDIELGVRYNWTKPRLQVVTRQISPQRYR
jgi:hypothetical protein